MRIWLLCALTIVLGIGTGVSVGWYRVHRYPWDAAGSSAAISPADVPKGRPPGSPRPKAVVPHPIHDFGNMDAHASGSYGFEVRNTGGVPLRLTKGSTSCKCTITDLEEAEVPPGGSVKVTVMWTGKDFLGPFTQTATVFTNDPENPELTLTIKGRITVSVRAQPAEVVFSRVALGDTVSGRVKVYGYRSEPLKISGVRLDDPTTAAFYQVSYEPIPPDEVMAEPGATGGYLVRVTVKSGLPLGAFQQKILVTTNLKEVPTLAIPVRGMVGSEVAIVGGHGWDEKSGVLSFGVVDPREGAEGTLRIRVGGPRCKEVTVKPVQIDPPDLLSVAVGQVNVLSSGQVAVVPLTISIRKGSRPANYLGPDPSNYGRITIETNHPDARQLQILVRFAVEG